MARSAIFLLVALVMLASPAFAQRRGAWHHHHHSVIVGSAFYFGGPWYPYYYPPPYYYGPLYEETEAPPAMYIEKFEGTPGANSGDIFCPTSGQYYPDVQECANGWQRIIHPPATAAQSGG